MAYHDPDYSPEAQRTGWNNSGLQALNSIRAVNQGAADRAAARKAREAEEAALEAAEDAARKALYGAY